jgi:uncharacterized membrane protein
MESRIAVSGHPLHAMLVVFPIALFMTAFLFDLVYLWRKDLFWRRGAFWLIAIGEAGALAAATAGLADYLLISMPLHAREDATRHLFLGLGVIIVYGLQLWLRRSHAKEPGAAAGYSPALVLLALLSVAAVGAQGWLGGQVSHVHGVGVTPERARPDATPRQEPDLPGGGETRVSGRDIFKRICAGCHGASGEGKVGPRLAGTLRSYSIAEIQTIVTNGRPPRMPAFRDQLSPDEIRAVAAYVGSMMSGR